VPGEKLGTADGLCSVRPKACAGPALGTELPSFVSRTAICGGDGESRGGQSGHFIGKYLIRPHVENTPGREFVDSFGRQSSLLLCLPAFARRRQRFAALSMSDLREFVLRGL
jgi:hypothetical protein